MLPLSCAPWRLVLIAAFVNGARMNEGPGAFEPKHFEGGQRITVKLVAGTPRKDHMFPPTLQYTDFLENVNEEADAKEQKHLVWSGSNLNGWQRFKRCLLQSAKELTGCASCFPRNVKIAKDDIRRVFDPKNGSKDAVVEILLVGETWTGQGFVENVQGFVFWVKYPNRRADPSILVGNQFRDADAELLDQKVATLDAISFDYTKEFHNNSPIKKKVIWHGFIAIAWQGGGTTVVELARRRGKNWNFLYQGDALKAVNDADLPQMDQPCDTSVSEVRMLDLPFPMTVQADADSAPLETIEDVIAVLQQKGPIDKYVKMSGSPAVPKNPDLTRREILEGVLSWASGDLRAVDLNPWNNNNCQIFMMDFWRHYVGTQVSSPVMHIEGAYKMNLAVHNSFGNATLQKT